MEKLSGYCAVVVKMEKDNVHVHYHDKEYGFPIDDDNHLFARLILEINQAGLSWTTILNKKDNFFKAFDNFDIDKVARYGDKQKERLLADAGIIRNRLKVEATIENAKILLISNTFSNSSGLIEKKLFAYDEYDFIADFLSSWCNWVREKDPSIICGHNISKFDLTYLYYIASQNDIELLF